MSKPKTKTEKTTRDLAEIAVPLLDMGDEVYCMRRVDIDISARQSKAMRLAFDGLQYEGAKIQLPGVTTDRPVSRPTDVVRYLLDQIADAYGLPR